MLDALDQEILRALQRDGRASHRALAAQVGVSHPTVAARIRRMEELEIIQGYSVVLDPAVFEGQPGVQVGAGSVACPWCGKRTAAPVEAFVGGRRHGFCCGTCRDAFAAKDATHRRALQDGPPSAHRG